MRTCCRNFNDQTNAWRNPSRPCNQDKTCFMNKRLMTLSAMVVLAALTRLSPHPPHVTPLAAIALFGGAYFRDRNIAFLLPLAALFLGGLALGFRGYCMAARKSHP